MPETYCVIGYPMGHTLSPLIHTRLFACSGRDADYTVREIPPEKMEEAQPLLRSLSGFNITIPHKQRIIPYLDELDAVAGRYQSVNTVSRSGGRLIGHNTDAFGFLKALETAGIELSGRVLLCGTGGVARTMAHECMMAGCELTLGYREADLAQASTLQRELEAAYGRAPKMEITADIDADFELMINATPVGMYPKVDASPVSQSQVARFAAVFDAVYNPRETKLIRMARECGKKVGYGLPMLVWQAAKAHTYWYDASFSPAQIAEITAAAEAELARAFQRDNLILCGFMGSGKSTVGKRLAAKTGRRFVDTDTEIERRIGMTISDYFAAHSEEAFRALESEALADLLKTDGQVVALGGGIPVREENRALLKMGGTVFFLDVSPQTVLARLRHDQSRPLLKGADKAEKVAALLAERRSAYLAAADFVVSGEGIPDAVAEAILSQKKESGKKKP